jgi:TonB-dependent SusC/RagA subfamily outer membrane receptor
MRTVLLLFVFLSIYSFSIAQNNLSDSRRTSVYTYIYKITKQEATTLYKSGMNKANEKYLHSIADSFKSSDDVPRLLPGDYLFTYASDNKLVFEFHSEGDVECKLINNNRDLVVALHTKAGDLINDAEVFVRNKKIPYDKSIQSYRLSKFKKEGLIKVSRKDAVYFFPVTRNRYKHPLQLQYKVPFKYVVQPVKKLFDKRKSYHRSYYYGRTPYEARFHGFMVFNKPKYKPGDTVYLKAFVETKKGKPIKNDLLLRLSDKYLGTDTIIARIHPYRNGGYEYKFVLNDSLDIDLDDEYILTLEELKSKKYDLDNYYGNLEDEEYAMKRKVVMIGKFFYEDYELGQINFFARSDKPEHRRNEPASIYLKATDENDMAVMDGRVQILIRPSYGSPEFHAQKVFLPDTLWYHEQSLDQIGETKIVLPDSIFPKASFDYSVECVFLNSNNESQTKDLQQKFIDEEESIRFTTLNDSLKIEWIVNGESKSTTGDLYVFSDGDYEDTLEQKTIMLPATIRINPFAKMYEVETENLDEDFEIKQNKAMISCLALRTKDSVTIQLQNPYHLQVWYNVFAGNKIIAHGLTENLLFKEKVRTKKNYFVSLQYIWGNKVWNEDYTIPYQVKLLTVSVNQPQFIYPGQTTKIDIDVKNASGKPVADADITAFSFTKKFRDAGVPYVPYLGKIYPGRKSYVNFDQQEKEDVEGYIKLNWQRWSREMRLDTIEYFKFLHPQMFYRNIEPAKDSITQIAPFVVINGDIQPIHQIYIDEVPVFFSQAQQLQRYSFRVTPGRHSFRFRTQKSLIRLDSFFVDKGVKTFLSINGDTANKRIRIEKMPDTLTAYEKILWSRYTILIENNFGENYAYTRQNENVYLLNYQNKFWASPILAGPFPNQYTSLVVENKFTQTFEAEGAYQYIISQGLIKQKQLRNPYPFSARLSGQVPGYNFHDFVLTEDEVDSLWEKYLEYRSINQDLFYNSYLDKYGNGSLKIGVTKDHKNDSVVIKNILLFRSKNPDFIRAYRGSARDLGYVHPGVYRLFFLLRDDKYFIKDSIVVFKNGINYYETGIIVQKPKDSVSIRISNVIKNLSSGLYSSQSYQMDQIKELFNDKYVNELFFDKTISGTVKDDKGNPIPGASVMIKGTRIGVSTDAHGNFILKAPSEGSIVISTVGYSSQELMINDAIGQYSLTLVPNKASLSEIVVTAYGLQRKKELSYSVSSVSSEMLMGRVAGLTVQADSIVMPVKIRGVASLKFSSGALFVVDGIPVDQNVLKQLDGNLIENVSVLNAETATAIYGSQAANGVVIITTKTALKNTLTNTDLPFAGNSLRNNFSDYAFWQPHLRTDENGKASFKVTFPDDITNWKTFVIAMADKKQTGFQEGFIKSFKSISANIALPQFAVEGDSINVIGKSLNYQMDSVVAKRSFFINDVVVKQNQIAFRNAWIDTFSVVSSTAKDSLKLKYTIEKDNGYFDGEERTIPVFKQGVLETSGFFSALNKDTSFSFRLSSDTNTIKLYAEASLLPVWEDEIESIRNYEYLCNEQLASKLKALLVEKKIDSFLRRNFKGEKNILDIISKLNQNKAQSGLWGWWNNTETSLWISVHVMEALTEADQMGYKTSINKPLLIDYLVYNLESYHPTSRLTALSLLQQLGAKVDFKKYADSIAKDLSKMSMYEKLRLAELKQKTGQPVSLDTLLRKQNHTAFGNIYWSEDNYRFFDNDIQNTLIIYRLLRAQKADEALLQKVRNYFLEKRKTGHWRNTYESSLILETILPDLLVNDSIPKPPSITISGKTITQFPFTEEIKGGQNISISKQGTLPVYFTAYEQHWNKAPKKIEGNFELTSFFENSRNNATKLKAGEPVSLKVIVRVNADADYVMVEIPIPAGCSYKEKNQSYSNNEVHREYFKNKVSIFCNTLKKGNYVFSVSLLPRYTGKYNLNPAKAEMMYFPVFFGREGMKKINIE